MGDLILSEKLVILSLNPQNGRPLYRNYKEKLRFGLSGAILFDLFLQEKIYFEDGLIYIQNYTRTNDSLLDQVLELLNLSSGGKCVEFWIYEITVQIKGIYEIIIQRLIKKKYLHKKVVNTKHGVNYLYPSAEPKQRLEMVTKIQYYIEKQKRGTLEYRGLIALIRACELYRCVDRWHDHSKCAFLFEKYPDFLKAPNPFSRLANEIVEEVNQKNRIQILA